MSDWRSTSSPVTVDPVRSGDPLRSVGGRVVERWVFNFRIGEAAAVAMLPVPWLKPVLIDGSAVLSFCPYLIADLCLGPDVVRTMPCSVGDHGGNSRHRRLLRVGARNPLFFAASRLTVMDVRDRSGATLAWVPGRESGRALVRPVAGVLLRVPFRTVDSVVSPASGADGMRCLEVRDAAKCGTVALRFTASFADAAVGAPVNASAGEQTGGRARSLFGSVNEFAGFFGCTGSLSPSTVAQSLTRIDLQAQGTVWRRVDVLDVAGTVLPLDAVLDSAFAGVGGTYRWSATDILAA